MDTIRLQKAEGELKTAAQSLRDFRTKDGASVEVRNFLDGAQDELACLIRHLAECRQLLDREETV